MDNEELLAIYKELDTLDERRENIVTAPLAYPGGKQRAIFKILPKLPYQKTYVESFGGAASVLLARNQSQLEVYNDRYGGIVCFYRVLRNPDTRSQLIEKLQLSLHSREEFVFCRDTWDSDTISQVERAFRWYYSTVYSFQAQGRNFGRSTCGPNIMAQKFARNLTLFDQVGRRLSEVTIENLDWEKCCFDYDSEDTVHYLDPPYFIESSGTQYSEAKRNQLERLHLRILEVAFQLKGFVAISSYPNNLYDNFPWDERFDFEVLGTATQQNDLKNKDMNSRRGMIRECLYIKES